jgi:hypothetical protein
MEGDEDGDIKQEIYFRKLEEGLFPLQQLAFVVAELYHSDEFEVDFITYYS